MKKMVLLALVLLVSILVFSVFVWQVKAVETTLFSDNFESYAVGTFPSSGGWELIYDGAGSQYQTVTDTYSNSPTKSLQLLGTNGWSANVQKKFTSSSSLLGYEAYMLAQSNTGPANHVGQIAFWNLQGAPWGKRFAVVQFGEDGNLYTAPIHLGPVYVNMGPYEANRWYYVKVVIDRTAGKYSVWIDDSLKAIDIAIPDTYEINALELESGHAGVKVFFDDTRVFETESLPPTPLSASITPLSASILVGQSVTFTSTASGGYPPYSYQWYLDSNPVSGATSSSWTFTPTTSGIYYVYLKVTDGVSNTAQSDTARITVSSVPVGGYSVSLTAYSTAIPSSLYLALFVMLSAVFITVRRKTHKKEIARV